MEASAVKTVLALVQNLMFSVKIRETASAMGGLVTLVSTNEELLEKLDIHPSLLILDLHAVTHGWEQVVATFKEAGVPVLAYGPHDQTSLLETAKAAGCDEVIAGSSLSINLPNLLSKYLSDKKA